MTYDVRHRHGHGASVDIPRREPRPSTPDELAFQSHAIAGNLDNFQKQITSAISAMVSASAVHDPVAWQVAHARARSGMSELRGAVASALAAKQHATDPQAAARLGGAPDLLADMEQRLDAAPQMPAKLPPALSCEDALLTALPPDAPVSNAAMVYNQAEAAVAAVFRGAMVFSDIGAFGELLSQHASHEISRRFRRFGPERQQRLKAILADSKVRARARAMEAARQQAAPLVTPPPGYSAPVMIDGPAEDEATRSTIEIHASEARTEPAPGLAPSSPVADEAVARADGTAMDKPAEYEETRSTLEVNGPSTQAVPTVADASSAASGADAIADDLAIPAEIEATILAEISRAIPTDDKSGARARRKRLVALCNSIASPYRERFAERLEVPRRGDRLVAQILAEFHPATVEALRAALQGLPDAAPSGEAGRGLSTARLAVLPGESVILDRDFSPGVTVRVTPRMASELPVDAPATTLVWRRHVVPSGEAGTTGRQTEPTASDEPSMEEGVWDALSTEGETYSFQVSQGGKSHSVRCEVVQEGLVVAVLETDVVVSSTTRSDASEYEDRGRYRHDEFRWKDDNVQRKRTEDVVASMAIDNESLEREHAEREAQLADPSLQGRDRDTVADELATLEFAAAQRQARVLMPAARPDAITLGNQIVDEDPVRLRQVLESMYATSDAAAVEAWLETAAQDAAALENDPNDVDDPAAGIHAPDRALGIVSTLRTQWGLLRTEIEHFVAEFRERAKDLTLHRLYESFDTVRDEGNRYGIDVLAAGGPDPEKADPAARAGMLRAAGILVASQQQLTDVRTRADQTWIRSAKRRDEYTPANASAIPLVDPAYAEYDTLADDELSQLVATFERLSADLAKEHSQRVTLACAEFPVLAMYRREAGGELEVDTDGLQRIIRPAGPDEEIAGRSTEILSNITTTVEGLATGRLDIWRHPRIVDMTRAAMLVVPGSVRDAAVRNQVAAAQGNGGWTDVALVAISLALAVVSAVATSGASLPAEVAFLAELGALGVDALAALDRLEAYQVGTAATATDYDRARAIAEDEPTLLWLALDMVAVGLDLGAMVSTFRAVSGVWRSVGEGGDVDHAISVVRSEQAAGRIGAESAERLEREIAARGGRLGGEGSGAARAAKATGIKDGRARVSADRVTELSERLGVPVEIDTGGRLVDGIEVHYVKADGGRIEATVVRVGPEALVGDVAAHQQTIARITRYNGLLGKLRRLWDRINVLGGGRNKFAAGSKEWESFEELKKLDELINLRREAKMSATVVDPQQLDEEISFLVDFKARHESVVAAAEESGKYGKGVGHIDSPDRWRGEVGMHERGADDIGAKRPRPIARSADDALDQGPTDTLSTLDGWEERADAEVIIQHAAQIDAHERAAYRRLERASEKRSAAASAAEKTKIEKEMGGYKAQLTEVEGERAATKYMMEEEPGAELIQGFSAGTGYDQVWVRRGSKGEVSEYIVVEAKGPGAKLGDAKGGQMTDEWVTRTAQELARSADPLERRLGQSILQALEDGAPPVTGRLVEADGVGGYLRHDLPGDQVAFNRWTPDDDLP